LCTVAVPWNEKTEGKVLGSSHIGIAPLPDDPRTRGKCGLKILQYMAAGLPVVSSPTGVNKEIIEHGITGFLAHSNEEWYSAIETLMKNRNLRKTMGEKGHERVIEYYSTNTIYNNIEQKLKLLLSGNPSDSQNHINTV
jgi:glycosyltransferase involved in cell wall biosynthesis